MHPMLVLLVWIAAHVLHVGFGITTIRRPSADSPKRLGSLHASFVASILPWTTLALFLIVFVIGGSSNVAQFAGESGFELWSLWLHAWPLLLFGNLIAIIVLPIIALWPPYPPRYLESFVARWCAVVGAGLAWHTVVTYFPDA